MVFVFEVPTLQYMSLVSVSVSFWKFDQKIHSKIISTLPDLRDDYDVFATHSRTYCMVCVDRDIAASRFLYEACHILHGDRDPTIKEEKWILVENDVCNKINRVPKQYESLLLNMIKLVGLEIRDWLMYLQYFVLGVSGASTGWAKLVKCINHTRWTPHGKIDELETARTLLRVENLNLTPDEEYKIACAFCLGDQVEFYWRQLSTEMKDFYFENASVRNLNKFRLINFWISEVVNQRVHVHNYEMMLEWAIRYYRKSAVMYFWGKLGNQRRFRSVLDSACYLKVVFNPADRRRGVSVMCFLLSQMTRPQLTEFLAKKNYAFVLERLLSDWVCVEFYMAALIRLYQFIHEDKFYDLLRIIADQTRNFQGDRHKDFFQQLLTNISNRQKLFIIERELRNHDNCCTRLCQSLDGDNIRLLLSGVSIETRRQIFLKCLHHVHELQWDFYESTVREFISTDDQMTAFKNECAQDAFNICMALNFHSESQVEAMDNFLSFCLSSTSEMKNLRRRLLCELPKNLPTNGEMQLVLMDKLLDKRFFSEKEITNFKKSLIYEHSEVVSCITMELLKENNKAPVLSDKILSWCMFTPEEIIDVKKQRIATSVEVSEKLLFWICEKKWELVEKCLNWCFFKIWRGKMIRFSRNDYFSCIK
uniref:Uncharacterized protein n=1 Tax=Strigamia maritima TaxID=126957 RepID=T1JBZ1_STRMM